MADVSKIFGDMWPIVIVVLIVLACIAVAVLIVVFINANKTIKEANKTVEKLNVMADEVNEQITPVLKKVDPLLEQANLTVETVNLELLRLDGILEDVQNVTGVAGKTANTIDSVTAAPVKAVTGAAERVRNFFGDAHKRKQTKSLVYPAGTSIASDKASSSSSASESSDVSGSQGSKHAVTDKADSAKSAADEASSSSATSSVKSDLDQAATLEELAAMLKAQEAANAGNSGAEELANKSGVRQNETSEGDHYVAKHQKQSTFDNAAQDEDGASAELRAAEIVKKLAEQSKGAQSKISAE